MPMSSGGHVESSSDHRALSGLRKPAAETETERTPAVPIRRSVHRDNVTCLECGWRGQMLRRHLTTGHGLSVDQYRARWKLPRDHPLTAPSYSERRSGLAKQLGLGHGRRSREQPEALAPETPPAPRQRSPRSLLKSLKRAILTSNPPGSWRMSLNSPFDDAP